MSEMERVILIISICAVVVLLTVIIIIVAKVKEKKFYRRLEENRQNEKERKRLKAKDLDDVLRYSESFKSKKEAAYKMLKMLLPEYKAREIFYAIEDKTADLYATITSKNHKNWEHLYIELIDERYLTEENILIYFLGEAFDESGYVAFAADADDAEDVSHLFTFEVISDMLEKLDYKDLNVLDELKASVKNIENFYDYLKICGRILDKQGYCFIVFADNIFDGEYEYTIVRKDKYEEMAQILLETGYKTVVLSDLKVQEEETASPDLFFVENSRIKIYGYSFNLRNIGKQEFLEKYKLFYRETRPESVADINEAAKLLDGIAVLSSYHEVYGEYHGEADGRLVTKIYCDDGEIIYPENELNYFIAYYPGERVILCAPDKIYDIKNSLNKGWRDLLEYAVVSHDKDLRLCCYYAGNDKEKYFLEELNKKTGSYEKLLGLAGPGADVDWNISDMHDVYWDDSGSLYFKTLYYDGTGHESEAYCCIDIAKK